MNFAESSFASDPVAQKHYLSQEVVPLLSFVSDSLEQDHYVHNLVDKFNISEHVVREQIKKYSSGLPMQSAVSAPDLAGRSNILEKEILGGLLLYEDFSLEVLS